MVVLQGQFLDLVCGSLPVGLHVALQELRVMEHRTRGPAGVLAL